MKSNDNIVNNNVGGVRLKNSKKTNPLLIQLIMDLKKVSWVEKAPIWRDIAKRLEKSLQNRPEVNVSRIARYVKKGETIIIPGKLLGAGDIDFPVTVAAFKASESAKKKIRDAGGKIISIHDLVRENPKGSRVRIIG